MWYVSMDADLTRVTAVRFHPHPVALCLQPRHSLSQFLGDGSGLDEV